MKTLIVYFSYSGNNEMVALKLKEMLHCDLLRITEVKKRGGFSIFLDIFLNRTPRLEDHRMKINEYDHVILVAPIWASKIATPLKSFLLLEKNRIRFYSLITVCSGTPHQKAKIEDELTRLVGKKPVVITELAISNLARTAHGTNIKNLTAYRLKTSDLSFFVNEIEEHLKMTQGLVSVS
jgi:menaquinone-dependent protoporphyrinogen IX oxidase